MITSEQEFGTAAKYLPTNDPLASITLQRGQTRVNQTVEHSHEFRLHAFCRVGRTLPYVVRGRNRAGGGHMGTPTNTKAVSPSVRLLLRTHLIVSLCAPRRMRTRMTLPPWATLVAMSVLCFDIAHAQIEDPASLVNMFIGTTNGGHVFPGELVSSDIWRMLIEEYHYIGATLPHGMVKVGMDTDSPGNVGVHAPD